MKCEFQRKSSLSSCTLSSRTPYLIWPFRLLLQVFSLQFEVSKKTKLSFLNWLNFTFPIPMLHVQMFIVYLRRYIFKLSNEFSQSIFRLCNTPGPRQAACKAQAQHSQGCNVFYKIVNCHLCWKAFPPRHLHFGRCCTLESWLTSSRNSCRSEVADILHKIQTAQWPEACRESAMQGNSCWEGAKKDW